jgi:hypothetical protein
MQALYLWSHTSSPFWFDYFGNEVLTNCLFGVVSKHTLLDLSLPSSQDYRHKPPVPASYFLLISKAERESEKFQKHM